VANFTCRILWWALVASLLVYVLLSHVVKVPPNPNAPISLLLPLFSLLAVATGIGTTIYRRRALSGPIQARQLDPSTPEGLQAAFPPFMINLALSESVGVYGLVLSFLSGRPIYAELFCGAAIVLMYLHRPTAPDLVAPMSPHHP